MDDAEFDKLMGMLDEPWVRKYLDPDDCVAQGKHLTSCDRDGYCNFCGYQDGIDEDDEPPDLGWFAMELE